MKFIDDVGKLKETNYRSLDMGKVEILMDSIKEVGIQVPVDVFEVLDTKDQYILSGHHRLCAIRELNKLNPGVSYKLPASIIRGSREQLESKMTAVGAVVSNMITPDMNVVDRAAAFALLKSKGYSAENIARICGKTARSVRQNLLVHGLPEEFKKHVIDKNVRDTVTYQIAATYKRDSSIGLEVLTQKKNKSVKKDTVKLNIDAFVEKLRLAKIAESTIAKVTACLR